MKTLTCKLLNFNLKNKRVLLRVDLNVPLANNHVADDFRLRSLQPTLDYLQKENAIIFIATHLGRPNGKYNPNLSTKLLLPWFEQHNYHIIFEPDLKTVATRHYRPGSTILLENLRFFKGEQSHDPTFAHELAACADYYVNDAFGALHRTDSSLTLVADCFAPKKKTIGFLIEKELRELKKLKTSPEQPFICIIGGGKIDTKISVIKNMLQTAQTIFLCPAVVFTFLKALHKPVGKSLIDENLIETARTILESAEQQKKSKLFFPLDYQIADTTRDGTLTVVDSEQFPEDGAGVSIGPKTIAAWDPLIQQAKTIFVNSAMGFQDRPDTLEGLHELLKCIAGSKAYTVVGGGDSAAAVERFGLSQKIDFISTGGGATLTYLSGQPLPGLQHIL